MYTRSIEALLVICCVIAFSRPATAKNSAAPLGNPCLKGNGNPCNENNGNLGAQGNAAHEKTRIDKKPPAIDLPLPLVGGRQAYISQVGDRNVASIIQTAPNAYGRIDQEGDANEADVTQHGSGSGYIAARQLGDGNFARLEQDGAGKNVLYLTQTGASNWAWATQQSSGALHNGARLAQTGNNNDMALHQNGGDNRALLTQEGDGNGMTAVQNGDGNRLIWTQQGMNLTDLRIVQEGGAAKGGQLLVTQTGIGTP
jgi:hypothetical protein